MSKTLDELEQDAIDALREFRAASEAHQECCEALVGLQRERAERKIQAVAELCLQDNPATPGKKYSPSQAGDVLQIVPSYGAYKFRVASAEAAVSEAADQKIAAKLEAELRIALIRASIGAGL